MEDVVTVIIAFGPLHKLRWEKAQVRIAEEQRVRNHPRRLKALYLSHARSARLCAARDAYPGRWWQLRQWRDAMSKARAL